MARFVPVRPQPAAGEVVLESPRALSESALWALNERYFLAAGPDAWREVPDHVTTSAWNARVQAELLFAWIEDLAAADALGGGVTVIELAAGMGRLAFHLRRALAALLADSPHAAVPVRLVLTDLVDANLDVVRQHPAFADELAAGRVVCVAWDAKAEAPPVPIDGPVAVVANYLFDGVPNDAYVVHDGLHALHMGLGRPEGADPEDARLIERVSVHWEAEEARRDGPWEALLAYYEGAVQGAFTLPVTGLALLERVLAWSPRALLLIADKGPHRLSEVAREGLPAIALHGSVSMAVNLHALGWWWAHRGGEALSAWHEGEGLSTIALSRGAPAMALRRAFRRWEDLDAGTYRAVWGMLSGRRAFTPREALSLLRLCGHEPRALRVVVDTLEAAARDGAARPETLREALRRVKAATYDPGSYDVDFDLGRVYVALGALDEAAAAFGASLERDPRCAVAWANLALCRHGLGDATGATAALARAVLLDPAHDGVVSVQRRILDGGP